MRRIDMMLFSENKGNRDLLFSENKGNRDFYYPYSNIEFIKNHISDVFKHIDHLGLEQMRETALNTSSTFRTRIKYETINYWTDQQK